MFKIEYVHKVTTYELDRVHDRYIIFHHFDDRLVSGVNAPYFQEAFDKAKMDAMIATKKMLPEALIYEHLDSLEVDFNKLMKSPKFRGEELTEWLHLTENIFRECWNSALKDVGAYEQIY